MMRLRPFVFVLAVAFLAMPSVARAIRFEKGGVEYRGFVKSANDKQLIIRVLMPDGTTKNAETFERSEIKILHEIDKGRLEKFAPDDPKAYRDYAELLAVEAQKEKGDPEAKDVAMRLFLVAAYLDQKQWGSSSLLSMSKIASTPAEARRCQAMAYLLDLNMDAIVLKNAASVKPGPLPKEQAKLLQDLRLALKDYRTGRIAEAEKLANGPEMDHVFGMVPGMIDKKAFLQKCTDQYCETCKGKNARACLACGGTGVKQTFPDDAIQVIVQAELWLNDRLSVGDGDDKNNGGEIKWSSILQARQVRPVPPLRLETITEYDPRKCLYRNGTWVAP